MRLHLVRHGESTWNAQHRVQGQAAGVPLTRAGRAQARSTAVAVAAALAGGHCDALLSSDLLRARQTADVVSGRLGVPVTPETALREQALGDLEGRPVNGLAALACPPGVDVSEVRWGGPGSESVADVHARLSSFVAGAGRWGGQQVWVSHGDALRVLLAVLAGRGHRDVAWVDVPTGSVTTVDVS